MLRTLVVGARDLGPALSASAGLQAVAVAVHLEDVDVVGEPVEQRAGETLRAEDAGPLVEAGRRQEGRKDRGQRCSSAQARQSAAARPPAARQPRPEPSRRHPRPSGPAPLARRHPPLAHRPIRAEQEGLIPQRRYGFARDLAQDVRTSAASASIPSARDRPSGLRQLSERRSASFNGVEANSDRPLDRDQRDTTDLHVEIRGNRHAAPVACD